ncbi:hypothetical protein NDU88_004946 [Pleurodeles waltl]|uniref:Uncharacterized protein n=1 Tax=Pleurodeles waltl TaxID=8319 RepID=A0AAV7T9J7_PLEWA|nr:hypothetical protein NDU88_004946 [Pleurodeles waltl]
MSGAEESFHQVKVRKATSGAVVSSKSQSSMACFRAERVLRRMQCRWFVLVVAGFVVLLQEKLQVQQEKGPLVCFGVARKHSVEGPGLRARSSRAEYRKQQVRGREDQGGVVLGAVQARTGADGLASGAPPARQPL